MRISRKRMLFLLTVVVALLAAGMAAAAQSGPVPSSEEGQSAQTEAQPARVNAVIGDDPDENGYSGPVVSEAANAPFAPSEPSPSTTLQDLLAAPGPDQQGSPDSVAVGPNWSTNYYYFFAAGSVFRPRDSSTGWDYQGNGCISARGGNDLFTIHLEIPTGSQIEWLRIFYYDTSSANSQAWVTTYNAQGALTDLTTVTSTGTSGYGTALSPQIFHVVDNLNNAYVLNWTPGTTGSSMRLCGLRVAYRLP